MVSVIVSDPIVTKFLCPTPGSTLLLFHQGMDRFYYSCFDFMNWLFISESIFRLEISKCSREQYPPATRPCYISKAGTLSGLEPTAFITINNCCLVGSRSWLGKGRQSCTFIWFPAKLDGQGESHFRFYLYLSHDLKPEQLFFFFFFDNLVFVWRTLGSSRKSREM